MNEPSRPKSETSVAFAHEYATQVGPDHLDLFGHVNNAAYLELFEEARWDWISRGGFGRREVRERGLGPTILEARVRFQREIRGRERILIRSRTLGYRGKIGRVEQIMLRADGVQASAAEFVFGLFDLASRKLVRPTPEWLRAVGVSASARRDPPAPR